MKQTTIDQDSCDANTSNQLLAGTAKVDITPPVGILMCGYADDAVSEGIHDPLHARVLVLKDGHKSLAIVSSDLVYLWSAKVVVEAKRKWNIDHVILNGSHTHAGPHYHRTEWYSEMEDKVIGAIGEAATHLFPARIGAGKGQVDDTYFGYNRRVVGEDGNVSMLWSNPNRKPVGPIDRAVRVIRVDDESGKPRALMVHFACHPVTLGSENRQISAEFPGAMAAHIEKELGSDVTAMFLQGAGGDVHPYEATMDGTDYAFDKILQSGISLGTTALNVAKNIETRGSDGKDSIQVKESVLSMGQREDKTWLQDAGVMAAIINHDIALAVVSYEPFVQHQLDFVAKSPFENTFFLGYSFFGKGVPFDTYLPTIQATKEGGYGAALGNWNTLEVGAGERMVEEAIKSIQELAKSNDTATRSSQQ